MGSKQANRYIKPRWGDDLKNRILEHSGIKIANKQPRMVSRPCGNCGYVNNLGNKYCENPTGCHYPLTQIALDEIKMAEQAKIQQLVAVEIQAKDQEMYELKDQMSHMIQTFESYHSLAKKRMNQMDDSIRFLTGQITKYTRQFGPRPLTETERNKIEEILEKIRALPPESEYI